jgi:hypothetical protein
MFEKYFCKRKSGIVLVFFNIKEKHLSEFPLLHSERILGVTTSLLQQKSAMPGYVFSFQELLKVHAHTHTQGRSLNLTYGHNEECKW